MGESEAQYSLVLKLWNHRVSTDNELDSPKYLLLSIRSFRLQFFEY